MAYKFEDFHGAAEAQWMCQNPDCPSPGRAWQAHHACYRKVVEGRTVWMVANKLHVFDPRNAVRICLTCHELHHKRTKGKVLTLETLPDSAFEFALELFGSRCAFEYLRQTYGGDHDPRLLAVYAGTFRAVPSPARGLGF